MSSLLQERAVDHSQVVVGEYRALALGPRLQRMERTSTPALVISVFAEPRRREHALRVLAEHLMPLA